jgi:transcriptional regulator
MRHLLLYKEQRDKLVYAMLSKGIKKVEIAKILGVTRAAITIQFPNKVERR